MTRRLSILFIIALFAIAMVGTSALAAKATSTVTISEELKANASAMDRWTGGADDDYSQGVGTPVKPQQSYYNTSLGFNVIGVVTNIPVTTQYDLPSNQTHPTTIDLTSCSSVPTIQGVYMDLQPASSRFIGAYSYPVGGAVTTGVGSGSGGGFPAQNATPAGVGFGAWHVVAAGGTQAAEDLGCGVGAYTAATYPAGTVTTGTEEGPYIWPSLAMDDPTGGGGYIAHIVAHETVTTDVTGYQSMVYYQSAQGSPNPGVANAIFMDSVGSISGCVVQNPNNDNVAIVYAKPRVYTDYNTDTLPPNDDVYYMESTNNGATWTSPTLIYAFDPTAQLEGAEGYWERAHETTALYTPDNTLHVLFSSWWADTTSSFVLVYPGAIYHWDNSSTSTVKMTGDNLYAHDCGGLGPYGGLSIRNIGKLNLSHCASTNNLYATYNRSFSGINGDGTPRDCSIGASGFSNLEIVIRASSTGGGTWGEEINVTQSTSDNCAAGTCQSEIHLGTARYNTDSIHIAYMLDLDPGINVQGDGAQTSNPIRNVRLECFNMQVFRDLEAAPDAYRYPFNTQPTVATATQTSTISNFGNDAANCNVNVVYIGATTGWLNVTSGTTLNVPAGATNTADLTFVCTGPATEGLYQARIELTYDDGTLLAPTTLEIPVDLYDFSTFCLPENQNIRTSQLRLAVNQASEVADNSAGNAWTYFSDASSYVFDGFMVMGNQTNDLTYSTFGGGGTTSPDPITADTSTDNSFGYLFALDCSTTYDSTTFANYRVASGKGVNRDTTIEFISTYYTPKLPGDNNSEFAVLKYQLYAGSNHTVPITGLNVGYYIDWDVPSDTGSDNNSETSAADFALIQQGSYTQDARWGAMSGYTPAAGAVAGKVFDNPTYIYPFSGFQNDSLFNWLSTGPPLADGTFQAADSTDEDLSSLIIGYRNATLGSTDTLEFYVFLASEESDASGGLNSDDVIATLDLAKQFACDNDLLDDATFFCQATCLCGDADASGNISIGDAVYIINFIFGGGPAPVPSVCCGDADGTGNVSIGDAVYIINFIFGGGPAPVAGCCP